MFLYVVHYDCGSWPLIRYKIKETLFNDQGELYAWRVYDNQDYSNIMTIWKNGGIFNSNYADTDLIVVLVKAIKYSNDLIREYSRRSGSGRHYKTIVDRLRKRVVKFEKMKAKAST